MDRFIASVNLVAVVSSCYLKSNMDRFIEMHSKKNLISNMDRFIERTGKVHGYTNRYLKSNMDRFIALHIFLTQ